MTPILNRSFRVPKGPRWYLDDATYLDSLTNEEVGLLSRKRDDYASLLKKCRRCAYLPPPQGGDFGRYVHNQATKLQFLFNAFREEHPLLTGFAAHVVGQRRARIASTLEVVSTFEMHRLRDNPFALRQNVDRASVSAFYQKLNSAHVNDTTICLTLGRYNSALTRYHVSDRIVDISICIESLVEAQTEVAFKCALYNSIVAESRPDRREAAFNLLKALYSARSGIVHGEDLDAAKKPFKAVLDGWAEVMRLVTNALLYYVLFLSEKSRGEWAVHLKRLALGAEPLITAQSGD